MDSLEKIEPEIENALQAHYAAEYGSTRPADEVWQAIESQLGEQESKAPAQVARSLNGAYKGQDQEAGAMREMLGTAQAKPYSTSRRRLSFWSPAIAAALVLALTSVLVGLLAVANGSKGGLPVPAPNLLSNPSFEKGLGDWTAGGGRVNYSTGIDNTTAHSGKASAYISSTVSDPDSGKPGGLGTNIPAQGLQGKRVKFSAFVKTEGDRVWAELLMAISGNLPPELHDTQHILGEPGETSLLDMDNMDDRPILGTTAWTRYDLVLDVPSDATEVSLGFTAGGPGRGWLDDVQLSVVGNDVPTTSAFRNSQPVNMGFEDGLTGWRLDTAHQFDFKVGTDTTVFHGGAASGFIQSLPSAGQSGEPFDLHQILNTENYKGKRIRFSAYLKTQNVQDQAQLWIGVMDISGMTVSMNWSKQVLGTTDWQQYEAEADVPENYSRYIYLAVTLNGGGQVWIDDAQLEVVGDAAPLASPTATVGSKP